MKERGPVYNEPMTTVRVCDEASRWDEEVLIRGGHPLQLWGWGEVKAAHGWQATRLMVYENDRLIGAGQVLLKKLPLLFNYVAYIPRGPVGESEKRDTVLNALAEYVKTTFHAVAVTVEPDWEGEWHLQGWQRSNNTILIPRTLILDLNKSEADLQAAMSKKTRQYIRKSAGDTVVRRVTERGGLTECLEIYKQTAKRAGFALHDDQYYYDVFEKLGQHSPVFAAFHSEKVVAFLWLAISSETAFELYGGMNDRGQATRANYALKWHAITTMKKWGVQRYDFNGLLGDGVSTFKQGFAEHETMLVGTYDRPLSPLYGVWRYGLPLGKKFVRFITNR